VVPSRPGRFAPVTFCSTLFFKYPGCFSPISFFERRFLKNLRRSFVSLSPLRTPPGGPCRFVSFVRFCFPPPYIVPNFWHLPLLINPCSNRPTLPLPCTCSGRLDHGPLLCPPSFFAPSNSFRYKTTHNGVFPLSWLCFASHGDHHASNICVEFFHSPHFVGLSVSPPRLWLSPFRFHNQQVT